ncbi:unnamed protein product, partial [Prorocentrum cordatum]
PGRVFARSAGRLRAIMPPRQRSPTPTRDFSEPDDDALEDDSAEDAEKEQAAKDLETHLLQLFARGVMGAKSVCIAFYHAQRAGAGGGNLRAHAKGPGLASGSYSKHLMKVLPSSSAELVNIMVPLRVGGARSKRPVLVAPPHEVLAQEHESDIAAFGDPDAVSDWADTCENHPFRHIAGDNRDVVPAAMYMGGIRYTHSTLAGKQDSLIGIFCYSLRRRNRHLLAVLSKKDMC